MVLHWQRIDKSTVQNKSSERDPYLYSHTVLDKGTKKFNRERKVFFDKWYWNNWRSLWRRVGEERLNFKHLHFISYTKVM